MKATIKIAVIAMFLFSIRTVAQQNEYPITQPIVKVNNSPWYGLGRSNLTMPSANYEAVQLAGYYGLLFKTYQGEFVLHQNGKVGIGTNNPNATLQIGDSDNTGSPANELETKRLALAPVVHSGSDWFFTARDNTPFANLDIGYGSNKTLTLRHDGNVGIGTTMPKANLQISGENTVSRTSVKDLLYLSSKHVNSGYDGFGTGIVDFRGTYQNTTPHAVNRISFIERGHSAADRGGAITFATKELSSGSAAPVERMRVDYNGNVGLGTTNPEVKLHIIDEKAISRTSVRDMLYLSAKNINRGYDGFGTGIVDFRGTYQNTTPHAVNRISFIERGHSAADRGGAITFATKELSSGSAAPVERMRVDYNGNVGIGTTSPNFKLDINAGGSLQNAFHIGTSHDDGGKIYTSYENGSGYLNFVEYDDPFVLNFIQTVDGGITEKIYYHRGKFGIGTSTTGSHKLAVEGSIGAREIKVEAAPNWSDFVFYENYDLPTLTEVENHIKEKGHLKDIPSAEEVAKDGFYLGAMDAKLLQKIEELTLYTIEQEKEIKKLKSENNEVLEYKKKTVKLEREVEVLKELVNKLLNKK